MQITVDDQDVLDGEKGGKEADSDLALPFARAPVGGSLCMAFRVRCYEDALRVLRVHARGYMRKAKCTN